METKTALVGADCRVELNSVTTVNLNFAIVINPRNSEINKSFRFNYSVDKTGFFKFGMFGNNRFQRFQHLGNRLMKFRLVWIAFFNGLHYFQKILIFDTHFLLLQIIKHAIIIALSTFCVNSFCKL